MPTSRTQVVKYIRQGEPGKPGAQGDRGPTLRGPQAWSDCAEGYAFEAGGEGEAWVDVVLYGDQTYVCKTAHAKSATNYPGSTEDVNGRLWQLGDRIDLVATKILLATYALVKNLGVEAIEMKDADGNMLFVAKDGAVTCRTGTFENVTISGQLQGVTGSFRRLTCENAAGEEVGSLAFGSDGRLWLAGDLYHQGYNSAKNRGYRFYTSDLWCRGMFGASQRSVMRINGNIAHIYANGITSDPKVEYLESATSSDGTRYYNVDAVMTRTATDYVGMPIDIIVFETLETTTYNYLINLFETQRVLLINSNDDNNNVRYYCNGKLVTLYGGEFIEICKMYKFQYPKLDETVLGAGIFLGTGRNNEW